MPCLKHITCLDRYHYIGKDSDCLQVAHESISILPGKYEISGRNFDANHSIVQTSTRLPGHDGNEIFI
jgi:hypothetical protein